jgi:subtilase family serine protease
VGDVVWATMREGVGMGSVQQRALRVLTVVAMAAAVMAALPAPAASASIGPKVVISQVYGGGGLGGAAYTHDYVELFNRGDAAQDVTGWSVQYASGGGSTWTSTHLSGTIQPGRYFLVRLGSSGSSGAPLPAADASNGNVDLGTSSGKVALRTSVTPFSGCPEFSSVDMVSYGYADCAEFTPAGTLSVSTAALRKDRGCLDSERNFNDVAAGSPNPRNASTPAAPCGGSTPPAGSPDLVVTSVSAPPASVERGSSFYAGDTTKNVGTVAAGSSSTAYFLSADSTPGSDLPLSGARSVPSLAAGSAHSGYRGVTVPASTPTGAYWLVACADATATVAESDETDNCRVSTARVTITGTPSGSPDLVVAAVGSPPATVAPGASFAAQDTTRNQGTATAAASTTRYFLSADAFHSAGDHLLPGARSVPQLTAGSSSTGSRTVTVPAGTPSGSYRLIACADRGGAVAESNESNNCRASAGSVRVSEPAPASGPDLMVTGLTNPPTSQKRGGKIGLIDTVRNSGNAPAGASQTWYHLSTDTSLGAGDIRLTGARSVNALAAGTTSQGKVSLAIPASAPVGTYYVLGCADGGSSVTETSESNNCRASAGRISVRSS